MASLVSAATFRWPVLRIRESRCDSTVRTLIPRSAAISLFGRPRAIRARTSRSRVVSRSRAGGTGTGARKLSNRGRAPGVVGCTCYFQAAMGRRFSLLRTSFGAAVVAAALLVVLAVATGAVSDTPFADAAYIAFSPNGQFAAYEQGGEIVVARAGDGSAGASQWFAPLCQFRDRGRADRQPAATAWPDRRVDASLSARLSLLLQPARFGAARGRTRHRRSGSAGARVHP